MRARVYSNGGNSTGGFTFNGGLMTGSLILAGNPSELLEAASKQYVDSSLVNLNAGNVVNGVLPSARLPAFTGDIIKPAGSSTINLAPTGVAAGEFVKPTVDAKGRVVGGGTLTANDIPNMGWEKLSLDRPTTLNGYGISNGVNLSGGSLTGFISFNGTVSSNLQAVTKQYIDVTLSNSSGIAIGDIIRKPYNTTPAGFLRCNGAEVSKTTYNTLYATINDRFSKQKQFTTGRPWQQQYNINEIQNNDLGIWTTGTSLPVNLAYSTVIVTKNRVYFLGGCTAPGVIVSTIYTSVINTDGTLGTWTTAGNLPIVTYYSSSIILNNKVYLIGGHNGSSVYSSVYTAQVNADGTLGSWTLSGNMPGTTCMAEVVATNKRVYVLGEHNGSTISSVYTAPINTDGTLGAWSTGTSLPTVLTHSHVAIVKNYVYLLGGWNGSVSISNIYRSLINPDGTLDTWTSVGNMPSAFDYGQVYVTKNRIYAIGGSISSIVYSVPINADGSLGSWLTGTTLPISCSGGQLICTKNRLYLMGGWLTNTVQTCGISGGLNDYSAYYAADDVNYMMPGAGVPWQQQYQINNSQVADITGWVATTTFPVTIANGNLVVTKNRVYYLGGVVNGSTPVNTTYTATINTDGTLGTWTAGANLPLAIAAHSVIVIKNRVYMFGGSDNITMQSAIRTAPINSDGTIGAWTSTQSTPISFSYASIFVTKNRVYIVGGWTGTAYLNTVYTAIINSDGTFGTWTSSTAFPTAIYWSSFIITKNRVYMFGGNNGSTMLNTIYTTTINSDGIIGPWISAGTLPVTHGYSQVFVTKNRVYLISGSNGSMNINSIYYALINDDGTIGNYWTQSGVIPFGNYFHKVFVANNKIYSIGGFNGASNMNTVHMASILEGTNDYSPYYDGTILPVEPIDQSTTFALPDLTQNEKMDTVSYIKY